MSPTEIFRLLLEPDAAADPLVRIRPTIPMERALLCIDCESIFEAEGHQTCPSCGSASAWSIGRALNRQTAEGEEAILGAELDASEAAGVQTH
ncbi:MAG TPA: hypothetical protein VMT16_07415 [Thermoanaerobaculia bacterium]|nr:hypothetical protein [Thermoanaerobaculia bacterium]